MKIDTFVSRLLSSLNIVFRHESMRYNSENMILIFLTKPMLNILEILFSCNIIDNLDSYCPCWNLQYSASIDLIITVILSHTCGLLMAVNSYLFYLLYSDFYNSSFFTLFFYSSVYILKYFFKKIIFYCIQFNHNIYITELRELYSVLCTFSLIFNKYFIL